MFQRVLAACVVAILLAGASSGLVAQEREGRTAEQAPILEWFSGLWSDIAAWFAGPEMPQNPPSSFRDGRCSVDPDGCPDGQ